MSKQHVNVYYKVDKCLITLLCECEEHIWSPLAEFNNGCQCYKGEPKTPDFVGWHGITQQEAQELLDEAKINNREWKDNGRRYE